MKHRLPPAYEVPPRFWSGVAVAGTISAALYAAGALVWWWTA